MSTERHINGLMRTHDVETQKFFEGTSVECVLVQRAKYEESHADETRKEHITHRKTKVICSLGGNTTNIKAICELLAKGMNICRINMA